MLRIPHACDRLGGIRHLLDSGLEEFFGRLEKFRPFAERTLTEQRSTNLKHQLDVVRVPEFECSTEAAKRGVILALVVELMRALVILFRTQERGGHLQQASGS